MRILHTVPPVSLWMKPLASSRKTFKIIHQDHMNLINEIGDNAHSLNSVDLKLTLKYP